MNTVDDEQNPVDDERRDRFLRVAERRTREILHKLRLLGNCSNKSAYSYTDGEVDRIFTAIEEQLNEARARFEPGRREETFRL